jgi:hypothetical protein
MSRSGLFVSLALAAELVGGAARASEADGRAPVASVRRPVKKRGQAKPKPETAASWQARHGLYFERNWGVEIVGVRRTSSGLMLRFDYRVLDPGRAVALNDKKARPYLIDEATNTALAVPAMENVGELRQVAPFQANRTYFIIFGNPGALVKHGGRVTLVVGNLRAEGLIVD